MILQVSEMSTNPIGFLNPSLFKPDKLPGFPPLQIDRHHTPLFEDHPIKELKQITFL